MKTTVALKLKNGDIIHEYDKFQVQLEENGKWYKVTLIYGGEYVRGWAAMDFYGSARELKSNHIYDYRKYQIINK